MAKGSWLPFAFFAGRARLAEPDEVASGRGRFDDTALDVDATGTFANGPRDLDRAVCPFRE
jgi:hypothetical protein